MLGDSLFPKGAARVSMGGIAALVAMVASSTLLLGLGLAHWATRASGLLDFVALALLMTARQPEREMASNDLATSTWRLRWLLVLVCLLLLGGKLWATATLYCRDIAAAGDAQRSYAHRRCSDHVVTPADLGGTM